MVKIVKFVAKKCSIHRQKKRLADLSLLSISLATIPIVKFKSGDPYETCAICTEDYVEGDNLRLLHCSHGNNRFYQFLLCQLLVRFILFFLKTFTQSASTIGWLTIDEFVPCATKELRISRPRWCKELQ